MQRCRWTRRRRQPATPRGRRWSPRSRRCARTQTFLGEQRLHGSRIRRTGRDQEVHHGQAHDVDRPVGEPCAADVGIRRLDQDRRYWTGRPDLMWGADWNLGWLAAVLDHCGLAHHDGGRQGFGRRRSCSSRRRHEIRRAGTSPGQMFMRTVHDSLAGRVRVDCRHDGLTNANPPAENLHDRRDAIRRAARTRNDRRLVIRCVYTVDDRLDLLVNRGRRQDHVGRSRLHVFGQVIVTSKGACTLEHDVDL
jgi:hypothetical protein